MSNITLWQGDCLEHMKNISDRSIDMILCDPPYIYDNHGGGKSELAQRSLVKDKHIDFISNGFDIDATLAEFIRICKVPNIIMFCSDKQLSKILCWFESHNIKATVLVWHKLNPIPLCNGKYLSDLEFIVYAHSKGAIFNTKETPFDYKRKIYSSSILKSSERVHPSQKPVDLLIRYILLHSSESDIVLDPFMGSGSTGVACLKTNRNFIGIELDENYFKIAKDRLDSTTNTNTNTNMNTEVKDDKFKGIKKLF